MSKAIIQAAIVIGVIILKSIIKDKKPEEWEDEQE